MNINWSMAVPIIVSALLGAGVGGALGHVLLTLRDKADRTAAQQTETQRYILAFLLVGAFISVLPVLTYKAIPIGNKEVLTYMLGQLSGMATMALGFYFTNKAGQDAVDAKRADNTTKALDAIKTVAQSAGGGSSDGDPSTLKTGDTVTIDREPDVDSTGVPWDAAIHAADKSKDDAGRWNAKGDA